MAHDIHLNNLILSTYMGVPGRRRSLCVWLVVILASISSEMCTNMSYTLFLMGTAKTLGMCNAQY